ncbi:BRcat domain-containing protein [Desulfitobacterium metallireducens]|uniref:Zn-finger containing protein n=1 Tax=Desulfitobacterium metallireducens DSM 15288 TaxID=871968 RepID=W0EBR2_9FIRM|nr:hypothetical protein [Desulfitobacterium metallireducens]AHF08177.1 Zn-finger containing protein [Desulfitobacterium metallireducens DSM 15288]
MNWFKQFMAGRYGVDPLSIALLIAYLPVTLIAQLSNLKILNLLALAILFVSYFRIFSRNIPKRSQENQKFLLKWYPVKNWLTLKIYRIKDRKIHRYFKCPNCEQNVRVPKGKGKIRITCPKCKKSFVKRT